MSAFEGFTGRVDSPLSIMDEIDALESLTLVVGAAVKAPGHNVSQGAALLTSIIAGRLHELSEFVGQLHGVGGRR